MRGSVLSLGLFGLALAIPTSEGRPARIEKRQGGGFEIGPPSSDLGASNPSGCDKFILEQTGFCIINGDLKPPKDKRQSLKRSGDEQQALKDAIKKAQLELQTLKAKKHTTEAEKKRIKALEFLIKELSGVSSQKPPSGGSTILIPGQKRGEGAGVKARDEECSVLDDLNRYRDQIAEFLNKFEEWERAAIWSSLVLEIMRQCKISGVPGPLHPDPSNPGGPLKPGKQ